VTIVSPNEEDAAVEGIQEYPAMANPQDSAYYPLREAWEALNFV
jgi:hypothetical protein